ncbi:BnaC08g11590D [Brassica napus]|uniref:BnaC08g11590D protein n=1 Tax=Brassica napus TaxID=3708 RepID=A0A078F7B5_BRANA|nr:BnaC08g11590D [Brassica napus]
MIEDIVNDVSNKLNLSAPSNDFDSLVGMESQMVNMGPLLQLDSDEVRIIGILGPPGIGKTTIARYILNRYSRDFQLSVFVENIKIKYTCSNDYNVKLDLQKHFMSQLTNELGIKIPNLGIAKDRLKNKKVLVIRDGVDRSVQVEAMAKEASWFGLGSRIIITTQDQKVLNASGINHIHKDSSIVIGINDETYEDIKCTSERAFERLYNLQFLRISSLGVNPRKFLVKLEMKNSKLKKLWEGMQVSSI